VQTIGQKGYEDAPPRLLSSRVDLGPELGLLHRESERPRSDRRICERAPDDVRDIEQLHGPRAAVTCAMLTRQTPFDPEYTSKQMAA